MVEQQEGTAVVILVPRLSPTTETPNACSETYDDLRLNNTITSRRCWDVNMAMLGIKSLVRTASPAEGALLFLFHGGDIVAPSASLPTGLTEAETLLCNSTKNPNTLLIMHFGHTNPADAKIWVSMFNRTVIPVLIQVACSSCKRQGLTYSFLCKPKITALSPTLHTTEAHMRLQIKLLCSSFQDISTQSHFYALMFNKGVFLLKGLCLDINMEPQWINGQW